MLQNPRADVWTENKNNQKAVRRRRRQPQETLQVTWKGSRINLLKRCMLPPGVEEENMFLSVWYSPLHVNWDQDRIPTVFQSWMLRIAWLSCTGKEAQRFISNTFTCTAAPWRLLASWFRRAVSSLMRFGWGVYVSAEILRAEATERNESWFVNHIASHSEEDACREQWLHIKHDGAAHH